MPSHPLSGLRAPAALVVAVIVTGGAVVAPALAGASHHPRRPKLPKVEHATDLTTEPVVRPSKGKVPTKLLVKNLVAGTGTAVTPASTVIVKYVGANYRTGKDFTQATWQSGKPTSFPLSGVIPGFAQGLLGMQVGGRREIVIPAKLGYGDHAAGPISRNETLVFVVDLENVSG